MANERPDAARAEVDAAEAAGDPAAWVQAMRRWWEYSGFGDGRTAPARIEVRPSFYTKLVEHAASGTTGVYPDAAETGRGLLFRNTPVVPQEPADG